MKIAFITESFPELSETFILGKVAELKKRGHQVTVFTQFKRKPEVHPDLLGGIDLKREVVRLPVWNRVRGKDLLRSLRGARGGILRPRGVVSRWRELEGHSRLPALVTALPFLRDKFDLAHAHYAYMGLRYLPAARLAGLPLVVSLLGTDASLDLAENPEAYQPLFRSAPRFIAVADYLKQVAAEHGCPPEKVAVIPNEVDTEFFKFVERKGRKRPKPVILTVGRLDWTKGYLYALEAMALLARRGVKFEYRIIGRGREEKSLMLAIKDLGLEDKAALLGPRDREGVRAALEEADLFLLTSVTESFGVVLLEAQATGLPVVATKVGGVPEVVKDGETGFLTPSRDPAAVADKLELLLRDEQKRLEMGTKARKWVEANFNKDLLMDRLESLYKEVVEEWNRS